MKETIVRTQEEMDQIKSIAVDECVIIESDLKLNCELNVLGKIIIKVNLRCDFFAGFKLVSRETSSPRIESWGTSSPRIESWGTSSPQVDYSNSITARDDLWAVLCNAPSEVEGLRQAIIDGRINGSTYSGDCACLVGTIANVRGCKVDDLGILKRNVNRQAEQLFLRIKEGDTPETNPCSKLALQWIDEWLLNMRNAFFNKI